jgi:hypothetical protein
VWPGWRCARPFRSTPARRWPCTPIPISSSSC